MQLQTDTPVLEADPLLLQGLLRSCRELGILEKGSRLHVLLFVNRMTARVVFIRKNGTFEYIMDRHPEVKDSQTRKTYTLAYQKWEVRYVNRMYNEYPNIAPY